MPSSLSFSDVIGLCGLAIALIGLFLIHSPKWKKKIVVVGVLIFIIPLGILIYSIVKPEKNNKEIIEESKNSKQKKDTTIRKVDTLTDFGQTVVNKSQFEDLGNNLYKILYNNKELGYIRLAPKSKQIPDGIGFNAIIQDPNKRDSSSGHFLTQQATKEDFLQNLGYYIDTTQKTNKKLIVTFDDGDRHLHHLLKYGKDSNTTKSPRVSYAWCTGYGGFQITGWLEFDK